MARVLVALNEMGDFPSLTAWLLNGSVTNRIIFAKGFEEAKAMLGRSNGASGFDIVVTVSDLAPNAFSGPPELTAETQRGRAPASIGSVQYSEDSAKRSNGLKLAQYAAGLRLPTVVVSKEFFGGGGLNKFGAKADIVKEPFAVETLDSQIEARTFAMPNEFRYAIERAARTSAGNAPDAARPEKLTVLHVDDNAEIRGELRAVLEQEGFEVMSAASMAQAMGMLSAYKDSPIRVRAVITDMDMGHITDGMDVLKAVKEQFPATPVILKCREDYTSRWVAFFDAIFGQAYDREELAIVINMLVKGKLPAGTGKQDDKPHVSFMTRADMERARAPREADRGHESILRRIRLKNPFGRGSQPPDGKRGRRPGAGESHLRH